MADKSEKCGKTMSIYAEQTKHPPAFLRALHPCAAGACPGERGSCRGERRLGRVTEPAQGSHAAVQTVGAGRLRLPQGSDKAGQLAQRLLPQLHGTKSPGGLKFGRRAEDHAQRHRGLPVGLVE